MNRTLSHSPSIFLHTHQVKSIAAHTCVVIIIMQQDLPSCVGQNNPSKPDSGEAKPSFGHDENHDLQNKYSKYLKMEDIHSYTVNSKDAVCSRLATSSVEVRVGDNPRGGQQLLQYAGNDDVVVVEAARSQRDGSGRERLKRHREEVAGRVTIPDKWGKEELLKDWMDYSSFDSLLAPKGLASARKALMAEARRMGSQRLRIQSMC